MKRPWTAVGPSMLVLGSVWGLAACSPALNWRSVAVPDAALQIALPCKPESATRTVELAGAPLALSMLGCEADGATFAVSYASLPDPSRAGLALDHWRAATLARIGGAGGVAPSAVPGLQAPTGALSSAPSSAAASDAASPLVSTPSAAAGAAAGPAQGAALQPFVPPGALALPQAVRTTVQGPRADGGAVTAHAVWFARAAGPEVRVYHAIVLADQPRQAVADTFFAGLELK